MQIAMLTDCFFPSFSFYVQLTLVACMLCSMLTETDVWKKSRCGILIVMMEVHLLLKTLGTCSPFGLCNVYTMLFLISLLYSCSVFCSRLSDFLSRLHLQGASGCIYIKCNTFWKVCCLLLWSFYWQAMHNFLLFMPFTVCRCGRYYSTDRLQCVQLCYMFALVKLDLFNLSFGPCP